MIHSKARAGRKAASRSILASFLALCSLCPLWFTSPVFAQQPPTLKFDFKFSGSIPPEYHITLTRSGEATFEEPGSDRQDPYRSEFRVSAEKAAEMFKSAESLKYFSGDFDYRKHKVANTGIKTFTYVGDDQQHTTAFVYTENAELQRLTAWFQAVAETQEFARKASFHRRFDKLALDNDVKSFVEAVKSGRAQEVESIQPLLRQVADDPSILNSVRERVRALLKALPAGS
jgi:hypothetical protein